jgi:uncharacterized damage-inducible protein DinB
VEELFTSRLSKKPAPHESTNTELVPEHDELKRRRTVSCDWYSSYVSNQEHAEEKITFTFTDDKRGMMTVQEILFHIVNHGSYHRGNIAHTLYLALVPHPIDGYGIYIHEKEPARRKTNMKSQSVALGVRRQ